MKILDSLAVLANWEPDFPMLISQRSTMTYGQLAERSDKLAYWLDQNLGKNKKPLVVYGHKDPYMLVCFLACSKSGRAYCPVDISMPGSRVQDIIDTVDNEMILATEEFTADDRKVVSLNEIEKICTGEGEKIDPAQALAPDDVFYIIFTSGSTGKPKGVQVTYENLSCFLDWSTELGTSFEQKRRRVFLNQAPFSFDLSVMDLYTCLACGGTLWTLSKKTQGDYKELMDSLKTSNTNVWVSTPSFAALCLADPTFDEKLLPGLGLFLFCGETLTNNTVEKLHERFPNAVTINTYGPTESTVAVTEVTVTEELNKTVEPLPVGRVKSGSLIEIADDNGKSVEDGTHGEIIILGDTVSKGYFNDPGQTEKVFFTCERDGRRYRAYHTGDEGYLTDGMLYYCGRIDLQVKLHGYRIELGDIEKNLMKLDGIEAAAVIPKTADGAVKNLVAFVVTAESAQKDLNESDFKRKKAIKNGLKDLLPEYMVPKKIEFIEALPLTDNGKTDRRKLGGMIK